MEGQLIQGGKVTFVTVTIASGETTSEAVDLGNKRLTGIFMPPAWTAADITFEVSADGQNFVPLNDTDGTLLTISAPAAANAYMLTAAALALFLGVRWLQVVSTNAQGGARTLTLAARPIA